MLYNDDVIRILTLGLAALANRQIESESGLLLSNCVDDFIKLARLNLQQLKNTKTQAAN